MNQVSISELKKLTAVEIKGKLPITITSDGEVMAVIDHPVNRKETLEVLTIVKTQCPNCKLEYDVTPPDGKPFFFTIKHPKG